MTDLSINEVEIGLNTDGELSSLRWWDGQSIVNVLISDYINIEKISLFDYNLLSFDEILSESDSIHYVEGEDYAEDYWLPQNQVSIQI